MFWRFATLIILTASLSACGFHLRGSGAASLDKTSVALVSQTPYGELEKTLVRQLKQAGAAVNTSSEKVALTVELLALDIEEQGTSRDATGRANEITLTANLDYLLSHSGEDLTETSERSLEPRQLSVSRSYYQDFRSPISDVNLRKQTREELYQELSRLVTRQAAQVAGASR